MVPALNSFEIRLLRAAAVQPSTSRELTMRHGDGRTVDTVAKVMQKLEGPGLVKGTEVSGIVIWSAISKGLHYLVDHGVEG